MATSALALINGVPRMQPLTASLPLIYDQTVNVVASGATPPSTLNTPVSTGTGITLPASGSYTLDVNSTPNLDVTLNGITLEYLVDWVTSGSGPSYTAIAFTFNLVTGDEIALRILRNS